MIVPLLILLCCGVHCLYQRTRKKGEPFRWDYTSTPALRRRSSILALSTANLADDDELEKRALAPPPTPPTPHRAQLVTTGRELPLAAPRSPPSASSDGADTASSATTGHSSSAEAVAEPQSGGGAGKRIGRKYDRVYRTNEPLPGKPLIEFEDKVWDLEDEYARLDRVAAAANPQPAPSTANGRQPPVIIGSRSQLV